MALTILGKVSKEIIKRLSLEESNTSLWVFADYSEGWKTIIEIEYSQEENFFFNNLPILDKWEKGGNYVQLFE